MTLEEEIVNRLEHIFQSRTLSMTYIVIDDNSSVQLEILKECLLERNFPLGHSLFIVKPSHLNEYMYSPDCIVLVENKHEHSSSFERVLSFVSEQEKCIIVVM